MQFSEKQQRLSVEGLCMLLDLKGKHYYFIYYSFKCYGYIKGTTCMLMQDGRKIFCVTQRTTWSLLQVLKTYCQQIPTPPPMRKVHQNNELAIQDLLKEKISHLKLRVEESKITVILKAHRFWSLIELREILSDFDFFIFREKEKFFLRSKRVPRFVWNFQDSG